LKKPSISDIAKELSVSPTLVSLVLNGKAREKRISKEIELKVKALAKKLNYKPNFMARSLRSGRSHTIGVIVADISSMFFSMIAKAIEDESAKFGYKVMFGSTDENPDKFAELIKTFKDRRLDGYIITPSLGTEKQILQLKKESIQFVLIDRQFPKIKSDYIVVDNYNASFNAVQHLINNGYKNIGLLSTLSKNYNLKRRVEGYKDALRKNGLLVKTKLIREIDFSEMKKDVVREVQDLVSGPTPIDALFFTNYHMTAFALETIYNLGIKVPEDLALASFDDPQSFRYSFSPVTAIAQPIDEMGKQAVHILMDRIQNPASNQTEFKQIVLPTTFNIRESCCNKLKNNINEIV